METAPRERVVAASRSAFVNRSPPSDAATLNVSWSPRVLPLVGPVANAMWLVVHQRDAATLLARDAADLGERDAQPFLQYGLSGAGASGSDGESHGAADRDLDTTNCFQSGGDAALHASLRAERLHGLSEVLSDRV
ncbi:MAG TPA: hypothetical protein VK756_11050 [Solirubrobacteraceae bacterium]|nr:hypothetical protein [Solirubrobacteraceae bacterium]